MVNSSGLGVRGNMIKVLALQVGLMGVEMLKKEGRYVIV